MLVEGPKAEAANSRHWSELAGVRFNSVLCNACLSSRGANLIQCGSTTVVTSYDNFIFNNTLINGTVESENYGTANYFSQNYLSGATLTSSSRRFAGPPSP